MYYYTFREKLPPTIINIPDNVACYLLTLTHSLYLTTTSRRAQRIQVKPRTQNAPTFPINNTQSIFDLQNYLDPHKSNNLHNHYYRNHWIQCCNMYILVQIPNRLWAKEAFQFVFVPHHNSREFCTKPPSNDNYSKISSAVVHILSKHSANNSPVSTP